MNRKYRFKGGSRMKKTAIFLTSLLLFTSCSLFNESFNQKNSRIEIEEKKIINDLPQSASLESWNLILVNPEKALEKNFKVNLTEVDNEQRVDDRIAKAWTDWREAASEAGHQLFLASAYRTIDRQKNNFNSDINEYINAGMTEEEAIEKTKEYLTEPGHSEHHTGLALDIVDNNWIKSGRRLETEYEGEASQKWMIQTMSDYGFILRYPEGKENITNIEYEPWHFRYVGIEHAKFMEEHNLVLEEYLEWISKVKEE